MSPGALRSCNTTHDVARVMEKIAPPDRTAELFRGVCDSLRDYREESERTINTLRSEVERLTVENEELRAESRASYNTKPGCKVVHVDGNPRNHDISNLRVDY